MPPNLRATAITLDAAFSKATMTTVGRPRAVCAALAVAIAGCGSPPPRPDHGTYTDTGAEPRAVKSFQYPRMKRLAIVSPPMNFQCLREWTERDLQNKGIRFVEAPAGLEQRVAATRLFQPSMLSAAERATLDNSLVLAVLVESLEGPGGGWNPFSGMISSAHQRTDITLSLHEPDNATALWHSHSRARKVMDCSAGELRTQLQELLNNIR